MGPHSNGGHPELSALRLIDLYSRTFGLEIHAAKGDWTVSGPDLPERVSLPSYTELAAWLAARYGRPALGGEE